MAKAKKKLDGDTEKLGLPEGGFSRLPRCCLEILDGPLRGERLAIDGSQVSVGSGADNDLILPDPAVSQHHLVIEKTDEGYRLRDLGSTNGSFVNRLKLEQALLTPGSEIWIGQTRLLFRTVVDKVYSGQSGVGPAGMLGETAAMRELFALIQRVAPSQLPVLIEGETGTGKEMIARALHDLSLRSSGPFQVFDCGTADRESLRSDLFGHEKGAFTGALERRRGAFELAHGGTLLFDELGELPLDQQTKLLRVVETGEVQRLGGEQVHRVDVRIVAATNRDLDARVREGRFREDLFFRVSVVRIKVPPLRDRRDDILLLADYFLAQQREADPGLRAEGFDPGAIRRLWSHPWPGNVRELRNAVLRSLTSASGQLIGEADLLLQTNGVTIEPETPQSLEDAERAVLMRVLREHDWNQAATARDLGISRTTLRKKIREYGIELDA